MEPGTDEQSVMTRYLLGEMSDAERDALETAYFCDDASVEKLEFVRGCLIDRYVAGRLSEAERERFESHFLESPHHRRKLAFATALAASVEAGPPVSTSRSGSFSEFLRGRRTAFALAAALMLLAIGSLFLFRGVLRVKQQPTGYTVNGNGNSDIDRTAGGTVKPPDANLNQNRSNDRRKGTETRTLVASLDLTSHLTSRDRGSPGESLAIGDDVVSVHLLIPRPRRAVRYTSYTTSLLPVDGREIWSQQLPPGSSSTMVLKIPAKLFSPQDYVLIVNGVTAAGLEEQVDGRSFRVERR